MTPVSCSLPGCKRSRLPDTNLCSAHFGQLVDRVLRGRLRSEVVG